MLPTKLDSTACILFLGSGFSAQARNIRGQSLPTGSKLREHLAELIGENPDLHDLKTIAEEVHARPGQNLYQELYKLFTVNEVHPDQATILDKGWRRIYTTNYDDLVEFYYNSVKKSAPSYGYDDVKPRKLLDSAIIHLHGTIRKANEENVLRV